MFGIGPTELLIIGIFAALNVLPLVLLIYLIYLVRQIAKDRKLHDKTSPAAASADRVG